MSDKNPKPIPPPKQIPPTRPRNPNVEIEKGGNNLPIYRNPPPPPPKKD